VRSERTNTWTRARERETSDHCSSATAVAFDRSVDPEERDPLPITADPRFEALFVALADHVAEANERRPHGRTPALHPQQRRDLEALGYAR
jgi:hypothetical protein